MCQVVWVHKLKNEKKSPVLLPNKMFKHFWISLMESFMANFHLMRLNWHIYDQNSSVRDIAFSQTMSFSTFNLFINFRDRIESQLYRMWWSNCGFSLSRLSFLAFLYNLDYIFHCGAQWILGNSYKYSYRISCIMWKGFKEIEFDIAII